MTKEELLEDLEEGYYVKIYTLSNEIFNGYVISFGDTGLKLNLSETNASKRISYERIVEYDVVDNNLGNAKKNNINENVSTVEERESELDNKVEIHDEVIEEKNTINRDSIFEVSNKLFTVEDMTNELIKSLDRSENSEYQRVKSIIDYAKKVHEYSLESDRVIRAVAELNILSKNNRIFGAFIGLIYYDLGDVTKAKEYFVNSSYNLACFELEKNSGNKDDAFEHAILLVKSGYETESLVAWLCQYAVEKNDVSIIRFLIECDSNYKTQAILYWFADSNYMRQIPDSSNLESEQNIRYFEEILENIINDGSQINRIISEEEARTQEIENELNSNKIYTGVISYYNRNGGNGLIKEDGGGTTYFYIKQVKDYNLQRILAIDSNIKRKVQYTKGLNFRNDVAADEIELVSVEEEQVQVEQPHVGFIDDYDIYDAFGKISSGNRLYNFKFDSIIDPLLYADLVSNPHTVKNLDVEFFIREIVNKNNKKRTKVACDIVGTKEYTQEEIAELISSRSITKREVDEWLHGTQDVSDTVFRYAEYEPLRPIEASSISDVVNENIIKKRVEASPYSEAEICRLLIPDNAENVFKSLPKRIGGPKTFQIAHRFMVGVKSINGDTIGVDLDKAEELFINAIQTNDQANSAVANLANIYIKRGGDYVVKGLQLLESYGHLLSTEKVTNLRIQLIDKCGDLDVMEKILISAIPRCYKKNTIWQYTAKLAGIYSKKGEWSKAAEKYKLCLDIIDQNKSDFAQHSTLRVGNLRNYIISSYNAGDTETAIKEAKTFLEATPHDLVIQSIVSGTFNNYENVTVIDDFQMMDLQIEDELIGKEDDISVFLKTKIQRVNLSSTFNKVNDVYSKTQDGIFVGNSDDVKKAVNFIQSSILKKNKVALSAEYRSAIYLGIAKIIYDSRNSMSEKEANRVDVEEVKNFGGRYARYLADSFVEKFATIDSIRFLYIQALKYLGKKDDGNIVATINMLIASFFVNGQQLPDELHDMKSHAYNDKYYSGSCISVKDFCIATFMLQDKQQYVNQILQKAFADKTLRNSLVDFFRNNTGNDQNVNNYYDFESLWKDTKRIFFTTIEALGREVKKACTDYGMVESVRQHVSKIRDLMGVKMLWNQDEKILRMYVNILTAIADTNEKYTVEEKEEGYRSVEVDIEKLKTEIEESPTEFGYDYLYGTLDELQYAIRSKFDELYKSSQPECTVGLSSDSVYVNDRTVEIVISFINAVDRQNADAVEVDIKGSTGAIFVRCEKNFTSIRSGEEREYIAVFALEDNVISEQQFDVSVGLTYQFYEAVGVLKTTHLDETLPVTISDKKNFKPIDNKYDQIFRGTSVDIKTPELFKGRSKLIGSICDSLSSQDGVMIKNRGIILWGQRRVGKNSVKDYLKQRVKDQYQDAYIPIELGSLGSCTNLKEFIIKIVNTTEDTLMMDYPDLYDRLIEMGVKFAGNEMENGQNYMTEFARVMNRLKAALRKISEPEKNIPLYYIDEFSYLYEWIEKGDMDGKEFMRFWKSFIQDYDICTIIIAQDNIPIWKARYENEFACMNDDNEITYLEFEGAEELICEPCQFGDKQLYTPDAVKLIYELTLGSAYLIVIFCKYIIDYLNKNYTERATKTIVQLVFEKEFLGKYEGMYEAKDFEPQILDVAFVSEEAVRINELNHKLLKEIAIATISSSQAKIEDLNFIKSEAEEGRRIFNRLRDRKIIDVEKEMYCSISMPLLKLYLLREQSALTKDVLNKLMR